MSDTGSRPNPLIKAKPEDPLGRAKRGLAELRDNWARYSVSPLPVPIDPADPHQQRRHWYPEPAWISGWEAFELLRLQTEPYVWAPPIARICQIIADQLDPQEEGSNYIVDRFPPNHELLHPFEIGSNHWFRALYFLLTLPGADDIPGYEEFVSKLYEWLGPYDCLRIRTSDLLDNALKHHWSIEVYSLPEAKQEPVWSFPRTMAWIATRDYLALARLGHFRRPSDEDEAVATEGVCRYNTEALGWLHTAITYLHCRCGALADFGLEAFKHCTCISVAWEELVRFNGGLSPETPELVFNIQEGWLSMTWPEGADDIRFLRRDILDRWPARTNDQIKSVTVEQSTAAGERDCREWLAKEFAADPEKRRSKRDFRETALHAFPGRLSERGFNLRVWPDLAREHGRDGAGAKKRS